MKLVPPWIVFAVIAVTTMAFAGEQSEVELKDGSRVYGTIVSLKDGVYTLKSETLGLMRIDEKQVRLISVKPAGAAPKETAKTPQTVAVPDVQTIQNTLEGNEALMSMVLSLQDDPDVQALLSDPAAMNALSTGDISSLTANPKFMKLLSNPKIQEIQRSLGKQ